MNFGEIITALRNEKGVYQKELADYLNVSIGTVSNYEQGIHNPDFDTLCKIADFYGVSIDYLMGRTKFRSPLKNLNYLLAENYTVGDLLNLTLSLTSQNTNALVEYAKYLKYQQGKTD